MDKQSSSASDLSLDSLDTEFRKKSIRKTTPSDENVDTILVPFYENDVLIKVPKDQKRKHKQESNSKLKKEFQCTNSYLIKKDVKKSKRTTYLEMFRKQFAPAKVDKKQEEKEIRSISPEYGDTERESIGDDDNNQASEFYNTESYNEIYYDKLLNQELEGYLENSFDEGLRFEEKALRSDSPDGSADNNLKSVSEVSQPRRHTRRATVQPIQNVKLGGLGPDMEKIKPRLERARSLQRYSEKVRMENRLRIYKKSVQADIEMKAERENSARRRDSAREIKRVDQSASYLVNKSVDEKAVNKLYSKSKSAGGQRAKERKDLLKDERTKKTNEDKQHKQQDAKSNKKGQVKSSRNERKVPDETDHKVQSVKSSARNRGINTDKEAVSKVIPPVQISFMVNVGGLRPSSALQTLEEKHRMYQEQVKAFTMDSNNM
ncbi:uncharacterized protein LOC114358699 [Ostrinia furnacalis]|uniref:uncharacterized protein LOC114358699 n=1 Tax=Ostrinia furnacalis TaxID=93504 RepID=UPI00103EB1DD|nr:uncharacterized protein LOC114358699 [Ostrinia furnacalis]